MESTYDVYVDSNASAHKARPIWSFVSPSLTMVVAIFFISYCCCCKGKKCPTCSCVRYLPNCMRKEFQKKKRNKTVRWRKSSSERWRQFRIPTIYVINTYAHTRVQTLKFLNFPPDRHISLVFGKPKFTKS